MSSKHLNKDYSEYNFEHFLQDDYFIHSVKNPDTESEIYWNILLNSGTINVKEFYAAKHFLESLNENKNVFSEEEQFDLWTKIDSINKKGRIKRNKKKQLYSAISIAACILILALTVPFFVKRNALPKNDIISYAKENNFLDSSQSDIQLIISEQSKIALQEETNIVYDSTQIKIAEKEISKKESASFNQLLVPKGKRSKLTLADGTKMYVNSGTRVIYPVDFKGENREIYVDGEIFIEVSRDEKRPFIVRTSDVNIQVLGTKFNVMAYESELNKQIVLTEGSIKILSEKSSAYSILIPSQMYELSKGSGRITNVDTNRYTSWINGLLYFDSERLDFVLLKLSRYYGKNISCTPDVATLKCSGKLDMKDDLNEVLKGLTNTLPIKLQYENERYNIVKDTM